MIAYKVAAEGNQRPGVCNGGEFENQVRMALSIEAMDFPFETVEQFAPSFELYFDVYGVTALDTPKDDYEALEDFFGAGKNAADETCFAAL